MYVALVCPYDARRRGGVRSHIVGLGRALTARGHRVEVIAPTPGDDLDGLPLVTCGASHEVAFGGTLIDFTWAPWTRAMDVARRGYDVMHFHTMWNPLFPFQLASCFRGPIVATFHDVPSRDTPRAVSALMRPMSAVMRRVWLDEIIAVSPQAGAHLPRGRFEIIPNGIDVPQPLPPEGARRDVLYLGRLEPRKDVATLIRAMALLGPDAPPLRIAGAGPLRDELEAQANASGVSVTFLGEVNDADKWRELRDAAVLVAPSTGGESFGIVLLEAMAAGAVPIAADNAGYRGVLSDRPELLFPAGDASALADRIRGMTVDNSRSREVRSWGEREWRRYEWPRIVAKVEGVYLRAVAHHG